jgi:shikimate kinase
VSPELASTAGGVTIRGMRTARRIVLVGMMGSGKTTVGGLLAESTGWRYVDNDELLAAHDRLTARELAASGEPGLREAESRALLAGLATPEPCIVGAAAGTILEPATRTAIGAAGLVVWLRGRPETLARRAGGGRHRPWLEGDPLTWLRQTAAERAPLYESVADITVDVDENSPAEVASRILAASSVSSLL